MAVTTVLVRSQSELLNVLPRLTGFRFDHCLVGIAFHSSRSLGCFRVPLPEDVHETALVHPIVAIASRFDAGTEFVFVLAGRSREPHRPLADTLVRVAHAAGFSIRDFLWQTPTEWGCFFDHCVNSRTDKTDACRFKGVGRMSECIDRDSRFQIDELAVHRALRSPIEARPNRLLLASAEAVLSDAPHPHDVVRVLSALGRAGLRDVVLLHWAFGEAVGQQAARELRTGTAVADSLAADWAMGRREAGPSPDRVRVAITACVRLRAFAVARTAAELWTIEGWMFWALGESSEADGCFSRALEVDEGCLLAQLLSAYIRTGAIPDWAFGTP